MGNTVAPRMCMCRKDAAGTATVTTKGRRRPTKSFVTAKVSAVELEQQQDETTRAGPAGGRVGADDGGGAAVGKQASSAAAAGVTVKIVLKRKDAEALVARLNAQSARERKARVDELKGEFRAGDCVGGASPSPCRDAWKPRLAPIKEN